MNTNVKKVANIVLKSIVALLIVFAVFMMVFTIVSVTTLDKNERNLFGFRFYIVLSDSMSESENNKDMDVHFDAGDIVIIKNAEDPTALQPGDIISFISQNTDSYGQTVTHMIDSVVRHSETGRVIGYKTFGTHTGAIDETMVEPEFVLGTYAAKLPKVGTFFQFTQTTEGYILLILIPFVLLIVYNIVNFVLLFKQYKDEQKAILQRERDEIEEQRRRNEELVAEQQRRNAELLARLEAAGIALPPEVPAPEVPAASEASADIASAPAEPEAAEDGASAPAAPSEEA